MRPKRRVLITGANGNIGKMLTARFHDDYDLVLADIHGDTTAGGFVDQRAHIRDLAEIRPLIEGVDTVVHLAGEASPQSSWESVYKNNILGTRNVLEAAREAGVRRVVYASSNHAMGMYDRDGDWPVYTSQLPRSEPLYGVSKVFGEVLGHF